MKKKLRCALICASIGVMLSSTTALADKKPIDFTVSAGGTKYTAANKKTDNEQYAYVTVSSANLISKDKVRYVVAKTSGSTEVSGAITYTGTSKPYKQTLKYNSSAKAKKGTSFRLKVKSYNYSVKLKGKWNS